MSKSFSKPTVKQHLAAIRQLFDYLITGGISDVNPAASVRGPRYVVKRGKTPVLSSEEARKLLDSILNIAVIESGRVAHNTVHRAAQLMLDQPVADERRSLGALPLLSVVMYACHRRCEQLIA